MRTDSHGFRLAAAAAVAAGLVLSPAGPWPACAQPVPPDQQSPDQQPVSPQAADPPARVGRLARISGTVSFHAQDATQWSPATRNYPVTAGDAFWTEPRAEAEIELAGSRIAMAGGTELDIGALDATTVQATEPQGDVYLHLRSLAPGESYVLQTPRATVTIATPGRYAIAAGDTDNPTLVTVLGGAAQVSGEGVALDVGPEQTATITGTATMQGAVGPAQRDSFIGAMLASERPPPSAAVVPPVVTRMPGGEDLAGYGAWDTAPDYGPVWYPQVASGWTPYREGHWAYVSPWGWTWIDDAPWGFAPFHYGRWADIGGRWAWAPGVAVEPEPPAYPVYAPALVTFFGVGAGAALAAGRVGWWPLGPREAYHPWYHASPGYVRGVNVYSGAHGANLATINAPATAMSYANRRAATMVPAGAVLGSQPIGRVARSVDPATLTGMRPLVGREPILPTAATPGVTPAVARRLNLAPAGALIRPVAAGPAIPAQATGAFAAHRPPLAAVGRPGGSPPSPVAAGPGLPQPALRQPGGAQAGPPPIARMTSGRAGQGTALPERQVAQPGSPPLIAAPGVPPALGGGPHDSQPSPGLHSPAAPAGLFTSPPLQPHPGVAAEPHAGALPPLARGPQQSAVVPPPTTQGVVRQPFPVARSPMHSLVMPAAPPGQMHGAAPAPPHVQFVAPSPQPQVHMAAPPPPRVNFAAPPPLPQMHVAAPRPPQVNFAAPSPPPQMHVAGPPPQAHFAAPSPPPQVHMAAPPPQVHIAAPPPPPQEHAAPPPPEHAAVRAQPQHQKRPGEP